MKREQAEIERIRAVLEQQPDIRLALLFGSLAELLTRYLIDSADLALVIDPFFDWTT